MYAFQSSPLARLKSRKGHTCSFADSVLLFIELKSSRETLSVLYACMPYKCAPFEGDDEAVAVATVVIDV